MASRPKALLVLGDPGFAASLAKFLGTRAFDIVLAKSSAHALEVLPEVKPDVVVASQLLPGMDGAALCQKVKYERDMPFIVIGAVTSSAGLNDLRRSSGADVVLAATFQPEMLVNALRKLTAPPPAPGSTPSKGFPAATGSPSAPLKPLGSAPPPAPTRPAEGSLANLTLDIEEAMRAAPASTAPPKPVAPAPAALAASTVASSPMDPAWIVSRALVDNVTGALRFVSGGVERTLYFAQGRPIVVTSNVPEERIGQILIRKGMLAPQELEQALKLAAKKGKRLAEIIVEMGVMTQRDHDEELASQYAERALALFAWSEAAIEFQPHPAPDELVQIRLAPERIVVEGLRRYYDAQRLEIALHDPSRVFYPAPMAAERLPFLNLHPLETAALVLVDGRRTVAEVAAQAPARLEALRALYSCFCLNLVV